MSSAIEAAAAQAAALAQAQQQQQQQQQLQSPAATAAAREPSSSAASPPSSASSALPQQFCLRWNNHQSNLLSVFEDLLSSEAFVDVTLACDGLQLKAHKMVLSACSPYFQAMLYNTPDRHPIVFLRDVRYHEMKALLEFMYKGEVSVDQENLSSLLKVAEGLKIKGLAEVESSSSSSANTAAPSSSSSAPHRPSSSSPFPSPLEAAAAAAAAAAAVASPSSSSIVSPLKRMSSPPVPPASSNGVNLSAAPKRKRAKPRRLSGSEAVPLASGLMQDQPHRPLEVKTEEINLNTKLEKVRKSMKYGFRGKINIQ